jgi:UDP-N-acetylmuramate: L-alanyl-gamma-D-glutamyl-meso-diaminopimelate ligase
LELLARGAKSFLFKDFAHAPSKVKASSKAVSDQFKGKNIIVCLELHTYSSLDPEFIKQYAHSLESADEAIIFYDPEALKIKNRVPIPPEDIEQSFAHQNLRVVTDAIELKDMLLAKSYTEAVLVMMSSGNFGGMDWSALQQRFL